MGRFVIAIFASVALFSVLPTAAALARRPPACQADAAGRCLPADRGVDLRALVREANLSAAPGETITEDDVVRENPRKIIYACYRSRGRHHGTRHPNNWLTCPRARHLRWVVTGLEYRLPFRSSEPRGETEAVSASVAASFPVQLSHRPEEPVAVRRAPSSSVRTPRVTVARSSRDNNLAVEERLDRVERHQSSTDWTALVMCCALAIMAIVMFAEKAFLRRHWPQKLKFGSSTSAAGALVPAFAAPVRLPRSAGVDRRIEDVVRENASLVRERNAAFAESDRLRAQLNRLAIKVPSPPSAPRRVSDWRNPDQPALPPAQLVTATSAKGLPLEDLPQLFKQLHLLDSDLARNQLHLSILEGDLTLRQTLSPERLEQRVYDLKKAIASLQGSRAALELGINERFRRVCGAPIPSLTKPSKDQLEELIKSSKVYLRELVHDVMDSSLQERNAVQAAETSALQVAASEARTALAAKTDELESERTFREQDAQRRDQEMATFRAERGKERDELIAELDQKQQHINALASELEELNTSAAEQDRQIQELSGDFVGLRVRIGDLEALLSAAQTERDQFSTENARLRTQIKHLQAMLDSSNGNGHGSSDSSNDKTRKVTQPLATVVRDASGEQPIDRPQADPPPTSVTPPATSSESKRRRKKS